MSQYLILPINKARLNSGYKNANYKKEFGFTHYGIDLVATNNSKTVYAQGNGVVKAVGNDSVFGNTVIIVYNDVKCPKNGLEQDLTVRYYHLASYAVKAGQSVNKDTVIGQYGNTGKYTTGAHLHVEFDTDTKYYNYAPGLKSSGTVVKAGVDTTVNPLDYMCVKTNSPDNQTFVSSGYDTVIAGEAEACKKVTDVVASAQVVVGSQVKVKYGAKDYDRGVTLFDYAYERVYTVSQIDGDRAVITYNGQITAAMHLGDLTLV